MITGIDSHSEPGHDWLAPYPKLPKLAPRLLAIDAIVGPEPEHRERFMGGTIDDVLRRPGDPLI